MNELLASLCVLGERPHAGVLVFWDERHLPDSVIPSPGLAGAPSRTETHAEGPPPNAKKVCDGDAIASIKAIMQPTAASHWGGRPADEEHTHLHTHRPNPCSPALGGGNFSLFNNHYEMASRGAYGATCSA